MNSYRRTYVLPLPSFPLDGLPPPTSPLPPSLPPSARAVSTSLSIPLLLTGSNSSSPLCHHQISQLPHSTRSRSQRSVQEPRSGSSSEEMKRKRRNRILLTAALAVAAVVLIGGTTALILTAGTWKVKIKESREKVCNKGWECSGSKYCCNDTITDFFKVYQFENLFSKRNSPVAHAVGFWDYQSFITAAALFESIGFCTTGGKQMQMMELCAFLGHVGAKTSCGYGVATGGPTAWGLCYNHEMAPDQTYCDKTNTQYPCVEGVEYYGRGAIPVYWNYNYGAAGDGIHEDLLDHPEYLEQNATMAFMAAMWRWMTPMKKKQPSAHDVFVGNWKPTKNDTLNKRLPGFGATMNVLYGDQICGKGYADSMNVIISHYQYYLDLMGVSREHSGDNRDCAEQVAFNPSYKPDDQQQSN